MSSTPYAQLSEKQKAAFLDLAVARSPENITEDGEASFEMQNRRMNDLNRQWQALEAQAGFKVTENDVWADEIAREASPAPPVARRRQRLR